MWVKLALTGGFLCTDRAALVLALVNKCRTQQGVPCCGTSRFGKFSALSLFLRGSQLSVRIKVACLALIQRESPENSPTASDGSVLAGQGSSCLYQAGKGQLEVGCHKRAIYGPRTIIASRTCANPSKIIVRGYEVAKGAVQSGKKRL